MRVRQQDLLPYYGRAIRELRKSRGESLRALAQAIDLSKEQVGKFERGASSPGTRHLARILDHFGITLAQFETIVLAQYHAGRVVRDQLTRPLPEPDSSEDQAT